MVFFGKWVPRKRVAAVRGELAHSDALLDLDLQLRSSLRRAYSLAWMERPAAASGYKVHHLTGEDARIGAGANVYRPPAWTACSRARCERSVVGRPFVSVRSVRSFRSPRP